MVKVTMSDQRRGQTASVNPLSLVRDQHDVYPWQLVQSAGRRSQSMRRQYRFERFVRESRIGKYTEIVHRDVGSGLAELNRVN